MIYWLRVRRWRCRWHSTSSFAVAGVATPLMMCIAEWRWLRTRDETYLTLAKRWAKGTAILFAVGAVSGTVLSFELGLLWPEFMRWAGAIIGMPFSLEGFAFFTEAIFLGIYLYGWDRVSPLAHLAAGAIVALSGAASAVFVVIANAWMNTPTGFRLMDGKPVDIDPIAAMMNPAALGQTIHMLLAAYAAVGFAVAGIHAFLLLRDRRNIFHRHAWRSRWPSAVWARYCNRRAATCWGRCWRAISRSNWPRWKDSSRPSRARRCASAECPMKNPRPRLMRSRFLTG